MGCSRFFRSASLLLLAALTAAPLAAQLQTGDLYGTVADAEGQSLPGVVVTLTGATGAPQVQVSGEDGQFRFLGLYPGVYSLKAELDGFSTVEYPDISIRVGGKATVEVTLSAAVTDVITVTGESPILDERKVHQGANVGAQALDKVPTARDPWSLLALAPGVLVDRFNLGGNESGQQSAFTGLGSSSRDNVFAVDGVILTDMNAVGASATYFDFGAFEEVQFTTASTDVTVATSGVTINQVTKRGTNEWRGQVRYLRTDGDWQSDPVELEPGLPGNQIESVEEYGADLGGPLWKDHLWIWGSYGESDIRNIAVGGQTDTTQLEDLNAKLNVQAGPKTFGVLHYWTNDKLKFGRGAGPDTAPESTLDQTTPQDISKAEISVVPSANFFFTALASRDDGIFTLAPQGGLDADVFTDENGVRRGSNFDFAQDAIIDQLRVGASYFLDTGAANHELKFGGSYREQENHSGTVWPRSTIVFAGELIGLEGNEELVSFPRNRSVGLRTSYESLWLQDTVTLNRWTINAGLRYDLQEGENLASSDPGNPLVPGAEEGEPGLLPPLNFGGNDAGGFKWETIVPRVGVTYALGEDRSTLLRGSFSRYAEQLGQNPQIGRTNPNSYAYAYFYFTDANGNLVLDDDELPSLLFAYTYNIDPANPGSLISANVTDPNLDPILTDEVSFSVEHQLRADWAVGLNLTFRNVHEIPETRTLILDENGVARLATRDDWVFVENVSAVLPNGQLSREVPVFDLREGLTPTGGTFLTNGDREQDYTGISLSVDKRLSNRWSLRGHVTYADWKWKIGDEFRRFDDPTDTVSTGLGYADGDDPYFEASGGNKSDVFIGGRWSFNLNGLYEIAPDRPWGFNLGGSVDGREGYASPPFLRVGSAVGSRSVQLGRAIDSFRLDDVIVWSLHADKDFTFGDTKLTLSLDGFNLTNEDYVLQVDRNSASGRAYAANEALSPRVFRLGATVRFR